MHPHPRRRLHAMVAVLISAGILAAAAWFMGGLNSTPWETTDSAGGTMGFNDRFSGEHYAIILQNASLPAALDALGRTTEFDGNHLRLLLAAHVILLMMLSFASSKAVIRFLAFQPLLFFWGWLGFWFLPLAVADVLLIHSSDREGFTDVPFLSILGQGAWYWACAATWWFLRERRSPANTVAVPLPCPPS